MTTSIPWIQLPIELTDHVRYAMPAITRTEEGILAVDGELVQDQLTLSCGLVVLATPSGVVVLPRPRFDRWSDLVTQGLARDLQA